MTREGNLPYFLYMWGSIVKIGALILGYVFNRKGRKDLKKNEDAKRDHEARNEHEDMVENAGDTGNLDDIRRRASE